MNVKLAVIDEVLPILKKSLFDLSLKVDRALILSIDVANARADIKNLKARQDLIMREIKTNSSN